MNLLRYFYFSLLLLVVAFCSCTNDKVFEVKGNLTGADSGMVYLVREGLDSVVVCDSAALTKSGTFKLKGNRPSAPEFYSLRVDSSSLWLVVDSTERITVNADKKFKQCTINGSVESADLLNWQRYISQIDDSVVALLAARAAGNASAKGENDQQKMFDLIKSYKDSVSTYIQHNAASPVAYYLLFKQVGFGLRPFEPYAEEDYHNFVVVANMWNKRYPESLRAKQLKDMMADVKTRRDAERFRQATASTPRAGYIDLSFPNAKGEMVNLSSLKGKHVLLEFCFLAQLSDEALGKLRELRQTYKNKGFEIYMVNFDKNKEVWVASSARCPWVSVLDEKQSSAVTYNFTNVPTNYFISKDGNIVGRDVTLDEVEAYLNAQ